MPNRNQHYVPRFYLKAFQSHPKRIHMYQLVRCLWLKDVSLRKQCYKRDFYGKDGMIERTLSTMEGRHSEVLKFLIDNQRLPLEGSGHHFALLEFICLQLTRTQKEAKKVTHLFDKGLELVFKGDSDRATEFPNSVNNTVEMLLSMVPRLQSYTI